MTARKLLALPLAFSGGVALASFAACTETNDNHCASRGGDEYCQEKTGKAAGEVFCTNNCGGDYDIDGCLVASEAPAEGCWLCDGQGSENCDGMAEESGSDSDTTTASETATETATETTAETTTETGPECMNASNCDAGTPLCEEGACVGCGEGVMTSCSSEYPETPACDAGTGTCVECTQGDAAACGGMTPVCEGNVCVACSEHSQCAESACNMATGACMPTDRVWWVNQSVVGPGTGTMADPYKNASQALSNIGDGEEGVAYFATPGVHVEKIDILGGRTVAIIGKVEAGSVLFNGAPTLDINQGASAFLSEIRVAGGNDVGVRCNACELWVDASYIVDNDDGAISIQGAGMVELRNSAAGGNLLGFPAIAVGTGQLSVLYSTIVGGTGGSPAVLCQNGANVQIRNSLIAALQVEDEIACDGATLLNNALEMVVPDNVTIAELNPNWFIDFAGGDLRLGASAPAEIATAASWQTGDPATDIDGDPRPSVDGTADYAGADIPN